MRNHILLAFAALLTCIPFLSTTVYAEELAIHDIEQLIDLIHELSEDPPPEPKPGQCLAKTDKGCTCVGDKECTSGGKAATCTNKDGSKVTCLDPKCKPDGGVGAGCVRTDPPKEGTS